VSQLTYSQKKWSEVFTGPDTREIYEWFAEEGTLPSSYAIQGAFDYSLAPMVKKPLEALRKPIVREVVVMSAVQCLKTLIGEAWLLWSIVNNPGPTQWLQPTDQEAKEHANERFMRLIESFPVVQKYFTDNRHDKTSCFLNFVHMSLRMEGCGMGNVQRKSIKNQMRSEIHQADKWIPGRLKEADSRMTQFIHNSKAYTESQPGWYAEAGVDDMDMKYQEGSQDVWNFACLSCGKLQPFYWTFIRQDGSRAAMRWEDSERTRRSGGEWRWSELVQTIRYECIHCGHAHADEPLTRRRMTNAGNYVTMNPDAPASVESFTWNQLAMANLPWYETKQGGVKNFLIAHEQAKRGYEKPLREFFQKVVAEPYNPQKHAAIERINTVEINTPQGEKLEYQGIDFVHRTMSIDVQADHFWLLIQAWSMKSDEVVLFGERVLTWSECADRQKEYAVPDANVQVDQSHRGSEVVQECCRHGHGVMVQGRREWVCWKAMRGSDAGEFKHFTGKTGRRGAATLLPYSEPDRGDPCSGLHQNDPRRAELVGKYCGIWTWSNPTVKDIVIARRNGRAKGVVCLTANGDWNEEYSRQIHSQKKVKVQGKYGGAKWKWEGFRDDHLLDCRCMNTVRAMQLVGLIQTHDDQS